MPDCTSHTRAPLTVELGRRSRQIIRYGSGNLFFLFNRSVLETVSTTQAGDVFVLVLWVESDWQWAGGEYADKKRDGSN